MTATVTVQSTDFIPLVNSYKFIFIFFCKSASGKIYNIEEVDTKTNLCNKYGIRDMNFYDWNEKTFAGMTAKLRMSWRGKYRVKELLKTQNL